MFPHPGTRIAHPTNGCHPPWGRVLEASANEQTEKKAEGRALRSSNRYWDERGGGGRGRRDRNRREGHRGGRKETERATLRERGHRLLVVTCLGGGAERLWGGARSSAPWSPSRVPVATRSRLRV
ncbi:hypothetical protein HJG60_007957 [Phyllostomus discolor]|uniref:Uncharacterized protein n=1 Tax=Phyllostomus discolor TaxID=89673 RepID=A0A834BNN0_9CHIR|nr:hypothetical protein HJG60_007957 [Phyllostomus discolor]